MISGLVPDHLVLSQGKGLNMIIDVARVCLLAGLVISIIVTMVTVAQLVLCVLFSSRDQASLPHCLQQLPLLYSPRITVFLDLRQQQIYSI